MWYSCRTLPKRVRPLSASFRYPRLIRNLKPLGDSMLRSPHRLSSPSLYARALISVQILHLSRDLVEPSETWIAGSLLATRAEAPAHDVAAVIGVCSSCTAAA
jgi:hypothetical protein